MLSNLEELAERPPQTFLSNWFICDIAQVCHAKLLGVTISQDLTWNKHVENIVKKKPVNDCTCYIS